MRTRYTGLVFLLIILKQSHSNQEEILHADKEILQDDYTSQNLTYEKLNKIVENDDDCYERRKHTIPLKYQKDIYNSRGLTKTEIPIEYVIVRASKEKCTYEKDCSEKIFAFMRHGSRGSQCNIEENFYVGGDGYVYEGRGWDQASYWELNGLRHKAITVQFFGDYMKNIPQPQVIEAFLSTLQIGVWIGKVSKNYKITSMRELYKNNAFLGEELDKYLMKWNNWVNSTFIKSLWEYTIPKRLTFMFRSQWNASEAMRELVPITQPVGYVMISNGGERCFKRSECVSRVKLEQMESRTNYGDLLHNFYLGENGEVYEGRGWDLAPHWELPAIRKSGFLSVQFIGNFGLKPPSRLALNSLKLLIQTGVKFGKTSPDYRLFSLRQVYNDRNLTGEGLYRQAEGWTPRWMSGGSNGQFETLEKSQLLPIVSREDWGADFPAWGVQRSSGGKTEAVIDYVIAYDGEGRCFTQHDCKAWMRREQEEQKAHYGDLIDNFYIGEDGAIYEGRGWKRYSHWSSLFPNTSLITVKFMGSFEKNVPTWIALTAFNALLKASVDSGQISPDYKLTTLRQTYRRSPQSSTTGLEAGLKGIKSWLNNVKTVENASLLVNLTFPRNPWPRHDHTKLQYPIRYVVVGSVKLSCLTCEEFTELNKMLHNDGVSKFKRILDNFYIGKDGWAQEGMGWDGASQLNLKENLHNFLFVSFIWDFRSTFPLSIAMYGFQNLMESGVSMGKLAPDYKVVSTGQIFRDTESHAEMLSERIKSWDHWSESVEYSFGMNHSFPSGNSIYLSRGDWNAVKWTPDVPKFNRKIIGRVIVRNFGSRCFTREECTSAVQAVQKESLLHPDLLSMDNFYIGEDGHVYEGRGWDGPPTWAWVKRLGDPVAMTVTFLGSFGRNNSLSPQAVFAFEYLIKLGSVLEYIDVFYTLETLNAGCKTGNFLSEALGQQMTSWELQPPSTLILCP